MSDPAVSPTRRTWAEFWRLDFSAGGHPLTQIFSQRLGASIAYGAYRLGISPSTVTIAGAVVGLGASFAYAFLPHGPGSVVALAIAYQLAYGFDCADGQLARASVRTSDFGAWLDVTVDYIRYIAIGYALLALLTGGHHVALAVALVISGIFLVGTIVSLHTSISLQRQAAARGNPARGAPSWGRKVLRTIIDTPFLLLALCLLRDSPLLLSVYAVLMGTAYTTVALLLARGRLQRASPGTL